MRVLKRNGNYEPVSFDKVLRRVQHFCNDLTHVDPCEIAQRVCSRIYDGVTTSELDELAAQMCFSMSTEHPDFGALAARIIISNHHKNTQASFAETIAVMHNNRDARGNSSPLVSDELLQIVQAHCARIDAAIDYSRDYAFDYFGFKTLERAYLQKVNDKTVERPQHMWMRVALGIWGWDLDRAIECYHLMSQRYYTHATPTLFNAGTRMPAMSSCFLLGMEDSLQGIYKTISDSALISKGAGGIGTHVHKVRARGSYIRGTNGKSSGLVPMLRVYNATMRHANQAGRRLGSAAIYLEPWHADVFDFVALRRNTGSEEERCRDLFLALWVPDLFMERVKANATWSLMCPDECPGLSDVYGDEFKALYERYEAEGRARKTVKAQELWAEILKSQIETGTPYILYKDACQRSNQKNLGVIKSSNLCAEIVIYSDENEYGVCNLASIVLPSYVRTTENGTPYYDFDKLHEVVKFATRSMDRVIDRNHYPVPETRRSNMRHRPIGIGIQGLADVFIRLRLPYDSPEALELNRKISETMYHAALEASADIADERGMQLARLEYLKAARDTAGGVLAEDLDAELRDLEDGPLAVTLTPEEREMGEAYPQWRGAYSTFGTSPAAGGVLQFDMWNVDPNASANADANADANPRYDWPALKAKIMKTGLRHSLLIALMPTASTSQIMGSTESFEAITSNIYQRRTLAGEFVMVNKYLVSDLVELGLWNRTMKERIIAGDGSIQHIAEIPEHIRALYKTVWEIRQRVIIDQAAARVPYVCQTQSMNLYVEDPDVAKMTNMHFYGWSKGLKTGVYYLRTRPKAKTISFSLDPSAAANGKGVTNQGASANSPASASASASSPSEEAIQACRRDNPEGCLMCSA